MQPLAFLFKVSYTMYYYSTLSFHLPYTHSATTHPPLSGKLNFIGNFIRRKYIFFSNLLQHIDFDHLKDHIY